MPITVTHALSMTTPDDLAYENKPSDWNRSHAITFTPAGSEISQVFSNANGISFGLSGTAVTASYTVPSQTNVAWSGSNASSTFQTLSFNNANGASWSNNAGAVQLSYTVPVVTDFFSKTNTTFNGANISGSLTLNTAGLQVSLSVAPGGGGADGYNILAAGTQTAATTGTVLFQNSNGITFGMSNSSVITASASFNQTNQSAIRGLGVSNTGQTAGNTGISTGIDWVLAGSQSITLSQSTVGGGPNTVWIQHPAWITTAMLSNAATISNIRVSAGTTSNLLSEFTFNDANGISFGLNASTLTASHNGITSQSNQNVTAANGGFAFQTLSFSNANGISFGTSAGSAITASHNALTTARASTDAIGLNTAQTNVTWTVNSSGLSLNAGGYAGTGTSATNASITLNSNGLAISVGAGGGVTPVASASNGSFSFTTIGFSNANNVTFGTSAGNIITASVAAPGAAAENNWVNLLGANTAGNTTASGSTIGYSGINLTLSCTNGSVVNISVPATSSIAGASGLSISTNGSTISVYQTARSHFFPYDDCQYVAQSHGNGTVILNHVGVGNPLQFDRAHIRLVNTNSSNSSGSHSISVYVGLYTRNASTLSLLWSASRSTALTQSGTAGSYSLYSGMRLFSIGGTTTIQPGDYWAAMVSSTNSGGADGSYSMMCVSNTNSNFVGHFGSSHNTTYHIRLGQGYYTAATNGLPGSIAFSHIRGSESAAQRFPIMGFISQSV